MIVKAARNVEQGPLPAIDGLSISSNGVNDMRRLPTRLLTGAAGLLLSCGIVAAAEPVPPVGTSAAASRRLGNERVARAPQIANRPAPDSTYC